MQGQWIGNFVGTNTGHLIVNLDYRNGKYFGKFYATDRDNQRPGVAGTIILEVHKSKIQGDVFDMVPFHPIFGYITEAQLSQNYQDVHLPKKGTVTGNRSGNIAKLSWKTDANTEGTAQVVKSKAYEKSVYPTDKLTWNQFKEFVLELDHDKYIFRGQSAPWKLRTTFHRSGRCDLSYYSVNDVNALQRHITAATKHFFKTEDATEHSAMLSLAQHHGYPTPLLDWTKSPYVAAYFAFESYDIVNNNTPRIHIFDKSEWINDTFQLPNIDHPTLGIRYLEPFYINNDRAMPQQSVTTFSNVDDIEDFIKFTQSNNTKKYLQVIEIESSERTSIIRDLNYMGITAYSLFPGLDGVCKHLREINFDQKKPKALTNRRKKKKGEGVNP